MLYDFMYEQDAFAPETVRTFDVIITDIIELFYNIGDVEAAHYAETHDICVCQYNWAWVDGPCDVTRYTLEYAQITLCEMLEFYGLTEEATKLEEVGFNF